ncbi:MAG TPA: lytic transglycosylase domain-containing protein [Caldimonas sp.]|jgi:soluble lytic murein transglycosylase-like protein|nr:lytic transglycosylase domain-containing protein [Caldimonas sp.]
MIERVGSERIARGASGVPTRRCGHESLRCRSLSQIARGTVLILCVAVPALGQCQIYTGTSEQSGALVLSSFASADAQIVLIAGPAGSGAASNPTPAASKALPYRSAKPVSEDLRRIIEAAAARAALSPQLIHAVIEAESRYEPSAVSPRGAIGLMQLLPTTAKRFGAQDPFDPGQNVAAGTAYLKWLMTYFNEDLELALAGYNAGEQAVVRAGRKVPPYLETQAYVKKVMAAFERSRLASL